LLVFTFTLLRDFVTFILILKTNLPIFLPPPGPPSQSLGVDPVDPAVMRRPPRKKNAPIITKRLLCRVLFSASIIVIGTLFIYVFALKDKDMSRREQTMVSFFSMDILDFLFFFCVLWVFFPLVFFYRLSCAFALFLCFFSFASICSSCPLTLPYFASADNDRSIDRHVVQCTKQEILPFSLRVGFGDL